MDSWTFWNLLWHCRSLGKDADEIPTSAVSLSVCKKITKQCQSQWQTSWDKINSGRATDDLIPLIGRKHLFPRESRDRCTAITYVRLLLNDSLLKAHQFRIGVESTRVVNVDRELTIQITFSFSVLCMKSMERAESRSKERLGRQPKEWQAQLFCTFVTGSLQRQPIICSGLQLEYFWHHWDILKNHNVNCNLPLCTIAAHCDWSTVMYHREWLQWMITFVFGLLQLRLKDRLRLVDTLRFDPSRRLHMQRVGA